MKRSYTILYIDDDKDDLDIIAEAFLHHTETLSVTHACNGLEGLVLLEQMNADCHLPCLVIIDINMPIMDGKQTLEKIRSSESFRHIPVVLFSTSSRKEDRDFARKWNADFITKPSSFAHLEDLVEQFVQRCIFDTEYQGAHHK